MSAVTHAAQLAQDAQQEPEAIYRRLLSREAAGEALSQSETECLADAMTDLKKSPADVNRDLAAMKMDQELEREVERVKQELNGCASAQELRLALAAENERISAAHRELVAEKLRIMERIKVQEAAEMQVQTARALLRAHRQNHPKLLY